MVVDKNRLKIEGLKFGRVLQSVFRLASMFSVDHRAVDGAVGQSYEALNALVKQVQQFTFGFIDHRVLMNNILNPDRRLRNLESEFSMGGIGAVAFPAGITLGGFRRFLSVICDTPENIEANGGIRRYYERNKVEGVRVIAGVKGASSMEETVLEDDPESLLAAQRLAMESQPTLGLDLLMEAVGMSSASLEGEQSGDAGGPGLGPGVEATRGFAGTGSGSGGGGPGGSAFSAGSKTGPGNEITGTNRAGAPETEAFPGIKAIGANADYLAAESGGGLPGLGTGNAEDAAATGAGGRDSSTGTAGSARVGRTAPGLRFARVASSAIASDPNH